jgi:hypothetical protein
MIVPTLELFGVGAYRSGGKLADNFATPAPQHGTNFIISESVEDATRYGLLSVVQKRIGF